MRGNNLGDQIRDVVQDAMDAMDFNGLSQKINKSVSNAVKEVRRTVGPYQSKDDAGPDPNPYQGKQYYHEQPFNRRRYWQDSRNVQTRPMEQSMNKPVGKVAGIVMLVLGIIGMVLFGLASLVLYLVATFIKSFFVFGPLITVFMSIFIVCLGVTIKGVSLKNRTKRFLVYQDKLQRNNYFQIKEAAIHLGKSEKYIVKDLLRMIRLGMFPQGHLDAKKTCFIGDDATYEQYQKAELSYEERRKQEEEQKRKEATATEAEKAILQAKALGDDYVTQVREANDIIEGDIMSQKLDRLELIIKKIFEHVVKHPEQLHEIRKFIDYYLPLTLKLVNVYKDFEHQPIQSANITSSRKEIEDSLDTINDAFEKLFDGLYENVAMEVATDINVLNTLLAQEGLTKKDFQMK